MIEGRASETALRAARCRARHQVWDQPRVLDDPLAVRILGDEGRQLESSEVANRGLESSMRGGIVARSRLCEDALAEAVARGVRQYVIVGAGLDTFAYRNPFAALGLRVFEVDHPATQAFKRQRLAEAGIAVPAGVSYVAADLTQQSLADALADAGLDTGQPVFFAWLGVLYYLPLGHVETTLRYMASAAPGSTVVFDCWHQPHPLDLAGRLLLRVLGRRYAKLGEPWVTFAPIRGLQPWLASLGFSQVRRWACPDINAKLFGHSLRHLRMRVRQLFAVVEARV